ncbi:DUF2613 family protein [Pusillimonas sp. TS35]|uniref:SPOR domain-containing protein n=1 Tax=Paracandidimonas lactea TaxID=2895524 RepID=UPI00136C0D8D|nr:DUF2613 family protein [Paracandidimonas lactea]MYN12474.1 DUF2613 family protein [Pusillimonas sp. TS35]
MAAKRRKSSSPRSGGGTLFGILVGLMLGLVAAVGVALFVTKVPMPFADKASRDPANVLLPDVKDAPDPNLGLYGKGAPAGTVANGQPDLATTPLPGRDAAVPPVPAGPDTLGELISTLTKKENTAPAVTPRPAPGADKPAPGTEKPAPGTEAAAGKPGKPVAAAGSQSTYFLQAGAFRSASDAEAVMARIVMLGLPAQVQKAQVNGATVNRVRVGPFQGIDEMNRSRARLGAEKIETSVVRP